MNPAASSGQEGPRSSPLGCFTSPVVTWKEVEATKLTDSDSLPLEEVHLNTDSSSLLLHGMKGDQQPSGVQYLHLAFWAPWAVPNGRGLAVSERVDRDPQCTTPRRESWPWESDTEGGGRQSPSAIWGPLYAPNHGPAHSLLCYHKQVAYLPWDLFYSIKQNHLGTYI